MKKKSRAESPSKLSLYTVSILETRLEEWTVKAENRRDAEDLAFQGLGTLDREIKIQKAKVQNA